MEHLSYAPSNLEIKRLAANTFEGLGSVYGNIDHGGDIVAPGALTKSVEDHVRDGTMPVMGWQHSMAAIPGKWVGIKDTDQGLELKGQLLETSIGHDVAVLMKADAPLGLSIGYETIDSERRSDGVRVINEAKLWEVSVVSIPMNAQARIDMVKSLTRDNPRALEIALRDAGLSRTSAKTVVSAAYDLRDAVEYDEDAEAVKSLLADLEAATTEAHVKRLFK